MIGFWTGGNDFGIEGVWRWEETNEQISGFTNWAPGSPDGKSAENCMTVGFAPNSTDTFWKDAPCSGHHNYICQFRGNDQYEKIANCAPEHRRITGDREEMT
uniref:Uncharacterized protein n=1 Tax=Magallana gigas TaxID=29159 RepID=K1QGH3_MAGGI